MSKPFQLKDQLALFSDLEQKTKNICGSYYINRCMTQAID